MSKKVVKPIGILGMACLLLFLFPITAKAYTNKQLCNMARRYYKAHDPYDSLPSYIEVDHTEGSKVVIHLYNITKTHMTATYEWYTVDRKTGKGRNEMGEYIDLSAYKSKSDGLGKVSLKSGIAGKSKIRLSWSKVSGASGYQIRYSTDKKFRKIAGTRKVKGGSNTRKSITKLKSGKSYYVKIRAYKKKGSKTVYGKWSEKIKLKTK